MKYLTFYCFRAESLLSKLCFSACFTPVTVSLRKMKINKPKFITPLLVAPTQEYQDYVHQNCLMFN